MHIIIDLDDVLIKSSYVDATGKRCFCWTKNLKQDLGITADVISLLSNNWDDVIIGKVSLCEHVEKTLGLTIDNVSSNDFIKYWTEYKVELNEDMANWVADMHTKGHRFYIATNQENIRTQRIIEQHSQFFGLFDKVFTSADLGVQKNDALFYIKVLDILNIKATEACCIDDSQQNIDASVAAGIRSIRYTSEETFNISL